MHVTQAIAQAKAAGHTINDSSNEEYTKSEFLGRVGIEIYNPKTDQNEFVTLPAPLYLDTMKKSRILGEGDFPELLAKGNALLDQVLEIAEQLEPGEEQELKLKFKIYRRKTPVEQKPVELKFQLV